MPLEAGSLCVIVTLGPKHLSCGVEQLNVFREGDVLASSDHSIGFAVTCLFSAVDQLACIIQDLFDVVDGTYLTCRMSQLYY